MSRGFSNKGSRASREFEFASLNSNSSTFWSFKYFNVLNNINLEYGLSEGVKVTCAQLDDVVMEYFFDGDGSLTFKFPDGQILNNSDCKKSNNWEWQ